MEYGGKVPAVWANLLRRPAFFILPFYVFRTGGHPMQRMRTKMKRTLENTGAAQGNYSGKLWAYNVYEFGIL